MDGAGSEETPAAPTSPPRGVVRIPIEAPGAGPRRRSRPPWVIPTLATAAFIGGVALAVLSVRLVGGAPRLALPGGGPVAVLPVAVETGDRLDDWAEVGLTEMLATALADLPGLEVVSPERLRGAFAERRLVAGDPGGRERSRRLALAMGAKLVVAPALRRRQDDLRLEVAVSGPGGGVADAVFHGPELFALAAQAVTALAEGLDGDALRLSRPFDRPPFLERLYGMGVATLRSAGPAEARPYFEMVRRYLPHSLDVRLRLAECARGSADAAAARELYLTVLEEAQGRQDRRLEAVTLQALGELAALAGRADEAEDLNGQAYAIALSLGDRYAQARLLEDRARQALTRGERGKAEELFVDVLELKRKLGDTMGRADTLLELGSLALAAGDGAAAAELLTDARELARQLDDEPLAMRAVESLGEVARRGGDAARADALWGEALTYYERRGERRHRLLLTRNRAELALERGDLDAAEELFQDLLALSERLDDPASSALASLRLARILLQKGYPYQARTHLDRALELDRYLEEPITAQRLIAWLAYEQGSYRLAVDTQRVARRQAGAAWDEEGDRFLAVYEQALATGHRLPLPGEAEGPAGP